MLDLAQLSRHQAGAFDARGEVPDRRAGIGEREFLRAVAENTDGKLLRRELAELGAAVVGGEHRRKGSNEAGERVELLLGENGLDDCILLRIGAPVHHARGHREGKQAPLHQALRKATAFLLSPHVEQRNGKTRGYCVKPPA